ncbi:MAG: hypothetical protein ABEJ36_05260 [Candidatus Nanosalina sp.]
MNPEESSIKKTYEFETGQAARDMIKKVSDELDYRFQEMNSIAAAYDGPKEAVVKNGEKIEAYREKAQDKIEELRSE